MSSSAEPRRTSSNVIPAKAGIQSASVQVADSVWAPAFAGVTERTQS